MNRLNAVLAVLAVLWTAGGPAHGQIVAENPSNAKAVDAVLAQPVTSMLRDLVVDVPSLRGVSIEELAGAISRAAPPSLRRVFLTGMTGAPPPNLFRPMLRVVWERG